MTYKLKIRRTKPFELFNNLEKDDLAELGFFLKTGEIPRKKGKEIVAEHLWVKINELIYESNEIYSAKLTEEPRFLKHLHKGEKVAFSPENVLNAKSRKSHKKTRSIKDFVYVGIDEKLKDYRQVLTDGKCCYAVDPGTLVLRTRNLFKDACSVEKIDPQERLRFDKLALRFDRIELDKYHVRIDSEFIKKSIQEIRAKGNTQDFMVATPLIRISDRTYLSFNLVSKLMLIVKSALVYLIVHEEHPQLYFTSDHYDGFIRLENHTSESIVVDAIKIN
jgi:hypothetical protein